MSEIAAYKDSEYVRGKAPMTKREIRVLTIALLGIDKDDVVLEIGAGTGGLTMEAAHAAYAGHVFTLEGKEDAQELVERNAEEFDAQNVTLIPHFAPEGFSLAPDEVDKVIVGGTGGCLTEILDWCRCHLKPGGRLVCNFVTLENACAAKEALEARFEDVEIIQVGITRGERVGGLTMLKAANPIFIITAGKKEE
ncbi:MAG: precorrin-6Y C5,15-methyltransferase (decarboxylating) subunit CbiT [Eubacterium aggregans]|uniref:precorrin-6Y C5,15-methyltransferase (decarboxylating) subunit CbiT n=1 Tax=Eubacterium aggregans TaxID=81409 RepID=UPI0023F04987|nr:precorrin-6Y C5,15-methyltransferase (decarboxylating) subunit CbiT [Eubacterium aggregans]MDD4691246.1 precorrin-6Y C5,15-methyltransferase (decarboxylating) subunit CbiT [Eubacterium aggregans]MEA5074434.1 precorrin-6Y C5,15-methyltransferase (decarboxylating) subunit CbiT [Eubacterium aggregans]